MGLSPVWDFIKSPFGFNANAPLLSLWKYEAEIHTVFLGLNFSGMFKTISPYDFPVNTLPLSIVKVTSPAVFVILPYVKFGISKIYSSNLDKFSTVENLISSKTEGNNSILKIGNVVIENISIPGGTGIRTSILKTSFKNIISISLTPYITYGQQENSSQSIHDDDNYIIRNKSLRFYCNGNQTVNVCIIGIV